MATFLILNLMYLRGKLIIIINISNKFITINDFNNIYFIMTIQFLTHYLFTIVEGLLTPNFMELQKNFFSKIYIFSSHLNRKFDSMPVKRVEHRVFYSREESDRSMQMAASFCPLAHLHMLH